MQKFLGIILFLFLTPCLAQNLAGHVIWVKGNFSASGRALKAHSSIYEHDVLTTDAKSQGGIVFTDNMIMTFKESSNFSVDSYKLKKNGQGNFAGSLAAGGFRTVTGTIARNNPSNYSIHTPAATLGVRGTDYQTALVNGALFVAVYSGTVCIYPYGGPTSALVEPICASGLVDHILQMPVPC